MRAPGKFFAIGLVGIFIISFMFLTIPNVHAFTGYYGEQITTDNNFQAVQGQYTYFNIYYIGSSSTFQTWENVGLIIKWTYIPPGFSVPSENVLTAPFSARNNVTIPWWVYAGAGCNWGQPQRFEFDVLLIIFGTVPYSDLIHCSFVATPISSIKYSIISSPTFASLYKGENQTFTISFTNYTGSTQSWTIQTGSHPSGIDVIPESGSIQIPPNGVRSWSTRISPNGSGLIQYQTYNIQFNCHWIEGNVDASGGINIHYLSPGEPAYENFQLWFDPSQINVQRDNVGNAYLFVKNIGISTMSYKIIMAYIPGTCWFVIPPSDNLIIAPDDNDYFTLRIRYIEGPFAKETQGVLMVSVIDNSGVSNFAAANVWLVSGTFSVTLFPENLILFKSPTMNVPPSRVTVMVTNDESVIRSYGLSWSYTPQVGIAPLTNLIENLAGGGTTSLTYDMSVTESTQISMKYSPTITVQCLDTGLSINRTLTVIVVPGFPNLENWVRVNPGVSGIVSLVLPLTGGDTVFAGYLVGIFFIIVPLTIIGLAAVAAASRRGQTGHGGLVILMFYFLGLFISTISGLFPVWFIVFHIAVIALIFGRGWIGGGREG